MDQYQVTLKWNSYNWKNISRFTSTPYQNYDGDIHPLCLKENVQSSNTENQPMKYCFAKLVY